MIPRRRDPIGLYLHIPFCDGKCPYCDFYSLPAGSRTMDDYCGRLISELFLWGEKCPRFVDTLYFGGGTPSLLGADRLSRLITAAQKAFSFVPGAEITVEMNPCSAGGFDFPALRMAGANRISIGLQSALDAELQFLGRRHTARQAWDTAAAAQRAGFRSVSLDLMLSLEGQTTDSVRKSVAFCRDAGVTHVSAYLLKIEPGTRFFQQREAFHLPGDDQASDLYLAACQALEEAGLFQYEISNFSVPGKESRHNLKYWNGDEYLGIGPSAHSFFGGRRFYTPKSLSAFFQAPQYLPEDPDESAIPPGGPEEYTMLRLRLSEGLTEAGYQQRFQTPIPEKYRKNALRFQAPGLTLVDSQGIRLTRRGFLVSNQLIGEILW